jgi:hypothetical protein
MGATQVSSDATPGDKWSASVRLFLRRDGDFGQIPSTVSFFHSYRGWLGISGYRYTGYRTAPLHLTNVLAGSTLVVGSQLGGRVRDWHRASFMQHHPQGDWKPETTIRLQIPGVVVCIAGLVMYGWFCHYKIHAAGMIIAAGLGT